MLDRIWPSAAWVQVGTLVGGGMMISAASTRTWSGWQAASATGEGQLTFMLGGVAVLLGTLRVILPGWRTRILATVLGLWLSTAVVMITVAILRDIGDLNDVLGLIDTTAQPALYFTLGGGCVTWIGSLFGVVPVEPDAFPWEQRDQGSRRA